MTDSQESIDERLRALKQAYRDGLPGKIGEIDALAASIRHDPGSEKGREGLDALYHLVHKLAGSGGTFGLPEISDAAQLVEDACEALEKTPSADGWQNIEGLIEELRRAVKAALKQG